MTQLQNRGRTGGRRERLRPLVRAALWEDKGLPARVHTRGNRTSLTHDRWEKHRAKLFRPRCCRLTPLRHLAAVVCSSFYRTFSRMGGSVGVPHDNTACVAGGGGLRVAETAFVRLWP